MTKTPTSDAERLGIEYWKQFSEKLFSSSELLQPNSVDSPRRLQINYRSRNDPWLETVRIILPRKGSPRTIGVWLILEGAERNALFKSLTTEQDNFQRRILAGINDVNGTEWDWDADRSGKTSVGRHTIRLEKEADATLRNEWSAQHEWLFRTLEQFLKAFDPPVPLHPR